MWSYGVKARIWIYGYLMVLLKPLESKITNKYQKTKLLAV